MAKGRMGWLGCLNDTIVDHWALLERPLAGTPVAQSVNGRNLEIATVVIVAR